MLTIEEMKNRKIQYGYTNTLVSELSGVPVGTVNKIFSGETKQPRRETLLALDRVLGGDPVAYSSTSFMLRDSSPPGSGYRVRPGFSTAAPGGACDGVEIPGKKPGEYTIDDYLALPDDKRVELIDGYF